MKDVLVHAPLCLPELEALVMVECAFGRGDMNLVERGADSLLETVARVLFRRHDFDVRTQVHLAATGYRVLRYLYEDVLHRPEEMLAQIRLTLATPPRMPC